MSERQKPCSDTKASEFDFWIGEWKLTWPAEQTGGEKGEIGRGVNRVSRKFGNCVIEENFATLDEKFSGFSVSVYDPVSAIWRQTWVDSGGSYLSFTGEYDGQNLTLRTQPVERDNGEVGVSRMVFRDITADGLSWDWQGSKDGGESWVDQWNISYERAS